MWLRYWELNFFVIHIGFMSQDDMFYDVCFPGERPPAEVTAIFHSRSLQ